MKCERCNQRPATVHLTQVINNQKTEMNVCEYCARELQQEAWGFAPQFDLHHLLGGLMGYDYSPSIKTGMSQTCPKCGISQSRFVKVGLLGCTECYEAFEGQIIPLVRRIHGTGQHTGKVPKRTGGRARINKEIKMLKEKLQEAVNREEFEKAAEIRDQIKSLEKKLQ
ncbi:protein arginine kinase activator [Desulfohalotomaculum tongense]|uniref:UvrB/UvrC motif-containing protein n=1 Tax=Desulforadius tongensis TaxID=1216062 RepID=UPI00195EB90C|nr:UvrB/UvrC motif-containing protein [Desulforadius tongensis]MBM7853792.1 protein arginine kinase activator [Desulforadius tongensis]